MTTCFDCGRTTSKPIPFRIPKLYGVEGGGQVRGEDTVAVCPACAEVREPERSGYVRLPGGALMKVAE